MTRSRSGCSPAPRMSCSDGEDHGVHVLHVDGAAAPEQAVLDHAAERVDRPVGGIGRNDVEVAVHDERAACCCRALAPGRRRSCGRVRTRRILAPGRAAQMLGDVLGGLRLAVRPALAVVRGVEADQVARDACGESQRSSSAGRAFPVIAMWFTLPAIRHAAKLSNARRAWRPSGVLVLRIRAKLLPRSARNTTADDIQSGWRNWQTR